MRVRLTSHCIERVGTPERPKEARYYQFVMDGEVVEETAGYVLLDTGGATWKVPLAAIEKREVLV